MLNLFTVKFAVFRHDYLNILTSLKLGIENQDLNAIQRICEDVLKESGKSFLR